MLKGCFLVVFEHKKTPRSIAECLKIFFYLTCFFVIKFNMPQAKSFCNFRSNLFCFITLIFNYSPLKGRRAATRARLIATASILWCLAQVPVILLGRILPFSVMHKFFFLSTKSIYKNPQNLLTKMDKYYIPKGQFDKTERFQRKPTN